MMSCSTRLGGASTPRSFPDEPRLSVALGSTSFRRSFSYELLFMHSLLKRCRAEVSGGVQNMGHSV